jgi:hypothetical protein
VWAFGGYKIEESAGYHISMFRLLNEAPVKSTYTGFRYHNGYMVRTYEYVMANGDNIKLRGMSTYSYDEPVLISDELPIIMRATSEAVVFKRQSINVFTVTPKCGIPVYEELRTYITTIHNQSIAQVMRDFYTTQFHAMSDYDEETYMNHMTNIQDVQHLNDALHVRLWFDEPEFTDVIYATYTELSDNPLDGNILSLASNTVPINVKIEYGHYGRVPFTRLPAPSINRAAFCDIEIICPE